MATWNVFKVLALVPLLQCACNGQLIDIEVDVGLCTPLSGDVDVLTTLVTNLTSAPITADSAATAQFTGSADVVVIIPGYHVHSDSVEITALVNALLTANVNLNVIVVDIRPVLSATVGFVGAVVDGVLQIVNGLLRLTKSVLSSRIEITNLRIISLELGAHVAGELGRQLKLDGIVVAQITALSPLGPLINKPSLKTEVATWVEVYHSNADILGSNELLGHVNIILGDGKRQPRCPSAKYPSVDLCSVISSLLYYTEIVKGKSVVAKKCVDQGVSFPNPTNDCQEAYSSFGLLDVAVKATVCAYGRGDSVTIGLGTDMTPYSGSVLHVSAEVVAGILSTLV